MLTIEYQKNMYKLINNITHLSLKLSCFDLANSTLIHFLQKWDYDYHSELSNSQLRSMTSEFTFEWWRCLWLGTVKNRQFASSQVSLRMASAASALKSVKDLDTHSLLFLPFGRSLVEFVMSDVLSPSMNEDIVWDRLDPFFHVVMNADLEYT